MKIKHSILVITYNQEDLLPLCLDSVIGQSEMPYEVVICDDCSTDRTWEVVQHYTQHYPHVIKAYRNEPNLGVFGNINKIKDLPTGDFINFVSGDDMLPSGALEHYTQFIEEKRLNCEDPFVIYSDCLILNPDGSIQRISNTEVMNKYDVFESTALNCLWGWDTGMSIGLLKAMSPMETDIGYQADLLWHFDKVVKAQKHYYIPMDGYIYRANVGVTVNTKLLKHRESKIRVVAKIYERYPERITPKIRAYFAFDDALTDYYTFPTTGKYWRLLKYYFATGRFRPNNIYRGRIGIIAPVWIKNLIKKLLGKSTNERK